MTAVEGPEHVDRRGGLRWSDDVDDWREVADRLRVTPGVHRPSAFSAVLAASLPDLHGQSVIDAGSGAGLISLAALLRGAGRVVAVDHDARALEDTGANVQQLLGDEARGRLSLLETSWTRLGLLRCDLTLVNPPQRPAHLLAGTAAAERHVHTGGGHDGLDALRLLLRVAPTPVVLSTASSLLRPASGRLHVPPYRRPSLQASVPVPHDGVWSPDGRPQVAPVDVWRFERADAIPAAT